MSREITVVLGGEQFNIAVLPIAASKVWRDRLAGPFGEIAQVLKMANTVELNKLGDLADVLQQLSTVLLSSIDTLLELLFEYSSVLRERREWIEQNAYDDEAIKAFGEVLKLAFPFGVLLEVVIGPQATATSPNSPSPNGGYALPASGPKKKEKAGR